jgi:hypothetical protein
MTTRRELILADIATRLASAPSIGAPVYRSRVSPFQRSEAPAVIVEPVQDQASQPVIPKLDWMLTVRISVLVRASIPDQSADAIVQAIHTKMTADLTLGGLAYDVQPTSVGWEFVESDVPTGMVTYDFIILYRTNLQDIAQG